MAKDEQVINSVPPNRNDFSSFLKGIEGGAGLGKFGKSFSGLSSNMQNGLGAVGSMVGGLAGSAISGGMESGAGNIIGGLGKVASAIPGPWGAVASAGLQVVGGLVNRAFGSKLNQENINKVNANTDALASFTSNAGSFDALTENTRNAPAVAGFSKSDIGKDGWFSSKAKRKYNELKEKQRNAQDWADNSIENNADNLRETQGLNALANFAAFGGPLDFGLMPIGGAIDYELAQKRLQIMDNKNKDKVSAPVYAFGGAMPSNGADWTNGVIIVDSGGTHEQNPFEGVQMGVAPDGTPNLVEEGEVIYNDYVFSNRLKVPKAVREKYKLRGTKEITFADAAKQAQKESSERPNDPISKRSLEDIMVRLMAEQEGIREKRSRKGNRFDIGGGLFSNPSTFFGVKPLSTPDIKVPDSLKYKMLPTYTMQSSFEPKLSTGKSVFSMTPSEFFGESSGGSLKSSGGNDGGGEEVEISNNPLKGLRFIPALGGAIGVFSDLMGWTNKPDYSYADSVTQAASTLGDVRYTPIGDYMRYTPLDRLFYANQLGAQAAGTRRGILNTSGGNRGTAMAGLLAADYNAQNTLGNLFRQAEEFNLGQRERVATFNRATNMFNAENDLKAQMASRDVAKVRVEAATKAAALRQAADERASAGRSANLTNLFDSLGDIGREAFAMDMIKNNRGLLYDWMGRYKGKILDDADGKNAQGGFLTIKPKRRRYI